ncbi:class I SAM-dependent methyltransferase [Amniculibacterium sp. G2-70]|uniref:class I SAM-dependent methyltransferase n=1 Tax=Amniculibacterium sp. G2-70 TaxID=2767188 RepID=UPI0016547A33|nr:class I SAM-dependent methyltransferase [Amniculibacterium sp. G2-70]
MAWFKDWFNTEYYHILYQDRDFTEAEIFIRKLSEYNALPEKAKIIDLACGKGRHSYFLHQLGYEVLGVDLSEESIAFATKEFSQNHLEFKVHDMRTELYPSVAPSKVHAVYNLFTSFGYFDDENDDKKVFASVKNALCDNGVFVLDFLNEKWVRNTLVPEITISKGGIDFHIKKRIHDGHVIKDIIFTDQGEDFHFFEKVKLHTLEQIEKYAQEFGFVRKKVWGDYHLSDFDLETSPRAINLFVKEN